MQPGWSLRRLAIGTCLLTGILAGAFLDAACSSGGPPSPNTPPTPSPTPPASPAVRLQVGYIAREPRLMAPTTLTAPREEGWPAAGSAVQWVAHVLNLGTATVSGVPYAWRIDGEPPVTGVLDLVPGDTEVTLPWTWTFTRHQITFSIAPPPGVGDATTTDDQVTIASDALSIGFWVEKKLYDWMCDGGRPGFEREMQQQIVNWNAILARAVFPTSPDGALDRVRLDRVVVYPDGTHPANTEYLETDLYWIFPGSNSDDRFLQVGATAEQLANQTVVFHELLHERGLIDLYAYAVTHHSAGTDADGRVDIEESGKPIVGTFLMPVLAVSDANQIVFRTPYNGLMGSSYVPRADLTELCADGLNLWAGHRTPMHLDQWGNLIDEWSNARSDRSYISLLPQSTAITFTEQGRPLAGGTVDVYLDHNPFTYPKTYTPGPDLTLPMDAGGAVTLPGDVLTRLPAVLAAPPKAQDIVFGVRTSRGRAYVFVPVYEFNVRYFRGGGAPATLEVPVTLNPW